MSNCECVEVADKTAVDDFFLAGCVVVVVARLSEPREARRFAWAELGRAKSGCISCLPSSNICPWKPRRIWKHLTIWVSNRKKQ